MKLDCGGVNVYVYNSLDNLISSLPEYASEIEFKDEPIVSKLVENGFQYAVTNTEWCIFLVYVYEDNDILYLFLPQKLKSSEILYNDYIMIGISTHESISRCNGIFRGTSDECSREFESYEDLFKYLEIK